MSDKAKKILAITFVLLMAAQSVLYGITAL